LQNLIKEGDDSMCDSFQMIKLTYDEDAIVSTDIAIKKAGFAI